MMKARATKGAATPLQTLSEITVALGLGARFDQPVQPLPIILQKSPYFRSARTQRLGQYVEIGSGGPGPAQGFCGRTLQQVACYVEPNSCCLYPHRPLQYSLNGLGLAVREIRQDNGPGVALEIADRLLKAYQTTKPRGMGLGLPLSLQIVQKHTGHLWWEPKTPKDPILR